MYSPGQEGLAATSASIGSAEYGGRFGNPIRCASPSSNAVRSVAGMSMATVIVVLAATAGVIVWPRRLPEAVWAVGGALLLVVLGLLPAPAALTAINRGTDVCLFLSGMMLLSEAARREGPFGWPAAW